jgi:hypothetical protein
LKVLLTADKAGRRAQLIKTPSKIDKKRAFSIKKAPFWAKKRAKTTVFSY